MTTRIGDETRARIAAAWPTLLLGIASGALIRDCLARAGLSAQMVRAYRAENKQADSEWIAARTDSADSFMDEAMTVARDPMVSVTDDSGKQVIVRRDAAHARTYIDTLKWAARIRNPAAYGDKQQIDMNVRTVDLTAIIQAANARLARAREPITIEHEASPAALLTHCNIADLM